MTCPYRYLCEQVASYIKTCKMKEDCKRKEGFLKHKIPQQPMSKAQYEFMMSEVYNGKK